VEKKQQNGTHDEGKTKRFPTASEGDIVIHLGHLENIWGILCQ